MARVAKDNPAPDVLPSDSKRSIIAHLRGGPFDGKEFVVYRARRYYAPRVSRGPVRRALRMARRYAWYELENIWEEDELLHGTYHFVGVHARSEPNDRA
jgi:hypothetical protein